MRCLCHGILPCTIVYHYFAWLDSSVELLDCLVCNIVVVRWELGGNNSIDQLQHGEVCTSTDQSSTCTAVLDYNCTEQ